LSGKPGNVWEFDSCQGNVRDFTKSRGNVRKTILSGKVSLCGDPLSGKPGNVRDLTKSQGENLVREKFPARCILASIQVFSTSLLCVKC